MRRSCFDAKVAPSGYHWWYLDASSDDGANGLTIIGFVGSVFSPYYMRAKRKGHANPENHCAINVALYGTRRRWAMTERGERRLARSADRFDVGPSRMEWNENTLSISINERCAPLPFPIRGHVIFSPAETYDSPVPLDDAGKHHWQAVAPHGRVRVELENPKLSWSGSAYHDMNWGSEPLESAFSNWTWLRTHTNGGTKVLYDVSRKDGSRISFGRLFEKNLVSEIACPQTHPIGKGFWGMKQNAMSEAPAKLLNSFEDAPFYTRNRMQITLDGERCEAFHECLSLDRFTHPVVQLMLPFKMPRFA